MHAVLFGLLLLHAEDASDYLPGIAVEITANHRTQRQVAESISFAGQATQVRWFGRVYLNRDDKYRFTAKGRGHVKVEIGEKIVMDGIARDEWLTGPPIELEQGDYPLKVELTGQSPPVGLELFWQGDHFERERIPSWALLRDPSTKDFDLAQRGEELVRAARCTACHAIPIAETTLRAPSLQLIRSAIEPTWLVEYLQHPAQEKHGARMPDFGLTQVEARSVATFLLTNSLDVALPSPPRGNAANGKKLCERIGCLACHTIGKLGTDAPLGGGQLSQIAAKRTAGFFPLWLEHPERLNPRHRMPVFALEKKEIGDLAAYLATLGRSPAAQAAPEGNPDRGRLIVETKACANCHEIPNLKARPTRAWSLKSKQAGCIGDPDPAHHRPGYRFSATDRRAILAYLEELPEKAEPLTPEAAGRRLLTDQNCLHCHARGLSEGLRPVVAQLGIRDPKTQASLVPPALHGVGDKLQPEWLSKAIAGEAPRLRPWLGPRMPRFPLSLKETRSIATSLTSHDLLPSTGKIPTLPVQPEVLQAAQHLVGPRGLGCISCHAVGPSQPSETQPGALGPDLRFLGTRIRPAWFHRFLGDPTRLLPGIEMPAIQQAAPGILRGDLPAQRAALWAGLNAPNFTAPTTGAVQLLQVNPDGAAVILRDLFEHGPSQATVRPFAAGLPNGHNILLDLDTLGLRRWWIGDFARQKVRGKKWYWESAGTTLLDQSGSTSFLDLKSPAPGEAVGWLEWYEHTTDGARLGYRLKEGNRRIELTISGAKNGWNLQIEGLQAPLRLREPAVNPGATLKVHGQPGRGKVVWEFRTAAAPLHEPSESLSTTAPRPRKLPAMAGYEVVRLALPDGPMPTALAFHKGKLLVASLKGGIFVAEDTDGDGLPDRYRRLGDYLSAPFGLLVEGNDIVVSHRHELLRLKEDGKRSEVIATGWGVSADYHDWAVGPVRDSSGCYYLSLSCQEDERPRPAARGRGKVLRIDADGKWTEYAAGLRYAMGIVANQQGDLFVTDNQGVTNPFNELNHIRPGRHYGFFNKLDPMQDAPPVTLPAIQIPHPWTRSVNGVAVIPEGFGPFAGQLVGADYTTRKLIRMSLQRVGETYQGAAYALSRDDPGLIARDETFLGPLAVAFGPDHCLYVGSLLDSGWGGGNNRGGIERVRFVGPVPFGIREVRAHSQGFNLEFTGPVDRRLAALPEQYTISCYRRIPRGGYETPDQDRTPVRVEKVEVSADRRSARLVVQPLRPTFVYDLAIGSIHGGKEKPFPAVAYYTLNEVPRE